MKYLSFVTSIPSLFLSQKNGKGDLAIMSIEEYERLSGKFELYQLLDKGMEDIREGKTQSYSDFMTEFGRKYSK